jgi:hypothetical protein
MHRFKFLVVLGVAGICFAMMAPKTEAQVTINIGSPPECPYGYYDYEPYECAPYGYYGPEWFTDGAFIGAGPWYHGHPDFHGHVDNSYDPHRGYKGPRPQRGEKPEPSKRPDKIANFKGNEVRDGRGHVGEGHPEGGDKK